MKKIYFSFLILCLSFSSGKTQAQTITTIAGNGSQGYNGDNIAASIAQLNRPAGVTADNAGNIYIADFLNNRVRKINPDGFIITIAGNGNEGYNGDNITATSASLKSPVAIAYDQNGNTYIEDGNNNRIRKINSGGIITTIAGTGIFGYNGDNIVASNAQVNYPTDGILVDAAGNVYFSDTYNHRIRKINSNGVITTIAGNGNAGYNGDNIQATSAQLNFPYGLALDRSGNLFVSDGANQRIRKINTAGIITTVAGNGVAGYDGDNLPATSTRINNPRAIVVDAVGNIFIADALNNRIRKVNTNGIISTIAGTGTAGYNGDNITATLATLNAPNGLALDVSGNLLVADLGNSRIRKINNIGVILPLSLTKFTAQLKNGLGLLQWQTSNEINTQSFIIESGKDGIIFSDLGSVKASNTAGNNSYSYIDLTLKSGITYYRIRMADKDGKFTYSNTVTIKVDLSAIMLNIYPNPTENILNVSFNCIQTGRYTIQVADISGKIIKQVSGEAIIGTNNLSLDLQNYAKGTYILALLDADNKKSSIKFTKN